MWFTRGLQCNFSGVSLCRLILVGVCSFLVLNSSVSVQAKHLDHHHYGGNQNHPIHRRAVADENEGGGDTKTCETVKHFFEAMNVTIFPRFDSTGKFHIPWYLFFAWSKILMVRFLFYVVIILHLIKKEHFELFKHSCDCSFCWYKYFCLKIHLQLWYILLKSKQSHWEHIGKNSMFDIPAHIGASW